MRIRLIVEVDFPAQNKESPREVQKRFGALVRENFAKLPDNTVFVATEVVQAGDTLYNVRKRP